MMGYEDEDEDKPSERHLQLRNLLVHQIKHSNLHLKHVDLLDSRHARIKKKLSRFEKDQKPERISAKPRINSAKHRPNLNLELQRKKFLMQLEN
jgi:hypothetical protein